VITPVLDNYPVIVPSQLLLDLSYGKSVSVHFCEGNEIDGIAGELAAKDIAVCPIDGDRINCREDLYREFAVALRMPKGWYGPEEFAPNADAFNEYLDDVHEWVPANGHVVVIHRSERLWREQPRLAGFLVEIWQFSVNARGANNHLVFAW
jgi:hypothetical protein